MYPDKILQAHVGQTEISRVKILSPWAKAAQNGGENGLRYAVFVSGTMNSHFFVMGQISKSQSISGVKAP